MVTKAVAAFGWRFSKAASVRIEAIAARISNGRGEIETKRALRIPAASAAASCTSGFAQKGSR